MMKEKMYPLAAVLLLLFLWFPAASSAQSCEQSVLHSEFFQDPTQRQYAACSTNGDLADPTTTNDQCVQEKLNSPCTNNAACKQDATVTRETINEAIDPTELETLYRSTQANDQARKGQLEVVMNMATFNMGKGSVRQKFSNIFTGPNSPITNAAIAALQQKDVARCDVVCHKGSSCTLSDVSLGLRGTP